MKLKLFFGALVLSSAFVIWFLFTWTNPEGELMQAEFDANMLGEFVIEYDTDNKSLPKQLSDLVGENKQISRMPIDPWGFEYQYAAAEGGFAIWSRGSVLYEERTISVVYSKNDDGHFVTNFRLWDDDK